MKAIGNIQLIWRPGKGSRRISIGSIKKNETDGVRFQYNASGVEQAKKMGFDFIYFDSKTHTLNTNIPYMSLDGRIVSEFKRRLKK